MPWRHYMYLSQCLSINKQTPLIDHEKRKTSIIIYEKIYFSWQLHFRASIDLNILRVSQMFKIRTFWTWYSKEAIKKSLIISHADHLWIHVMKIIFPWCEAGIYYYVSVCVNNVWLKIFIFGRYLERIWPMVEIQETSTSLRVLNTYVTR